MRQHNIWCAYVLSVWWCVPDCSPTYLSTQNARTHTAVQHTSPHRTHAHTLQSNIPLHTERTHTHCSPTYLSTQKALTHTKCYAAASPHWLFTFLTNFKISDFNKENKSSLKMIWIMIETCWSVFNPLNAGLNPICHLLALLGAHHILHVSRLRVKCFNKNILD